MTTQLFDLRRSIRNFHFTQEQEILDLMFTITVKMANTPALSVKARTHIKDSLDDICNYLYEEIEAIEAEEHNTDEKL